MSRFEEVVNEAIDHVVLSETLRAEELAAHIAERVRERQDGLPLRGPHRGALPGDGHGPRVRHLQTQEIYKLHGVAVASERGTRTLTGVEAHGMTACPCAQEELTDARASASRPTASRTARSSASSTPSPSPPTTSAESASCTSDAPRASTSTSTRPTSSTSSSSR